jgi:hypothetical protein
MHDLELKTFDEVFNVLRSMLKEQGEATASAVRTYLRDNDAESGETAAYREGKLAGLNAADAAVWELYRGRLSPEQLAELEAQSAIASAHAEALLDATAHLFPENADDRARVRRMANQRRRQGLS